MAKNPLDAPATAGRMWLLFREGVLRREAWARAYTLAGYQPSARDWGRFLDRLLLTFGTAFVILGVVFFFAFNWADLPRLGKFGIVQAALVLATVLTFALDVRTWGGRLALAASATMVGVTLAVVGQAYQTGADSFRLFLTWAILITPWVLWGRWNLMWLMWVVLLNTSLVLFWEQTQNPRDGETLNYILSLVNFGFFIGWAALGQVNVRVLDFVHEGRWFLYILAFLVLGYATYLWEDWVWRFGTDYATLGSTAPLAYAIIIGVTVIFFSTIDKDIGVISLAAISVLISVTTWLIDFFVFNIFETYDIIGASCISGTIILALTTVTAYGLLWLQRHWSNNDTLAEGGAA